ncbi:hypothetical protein TNCV_1085361 [Trichonephila clavipes]|nr:hypothetical protein TNCV_1085361 [Trichonephila clavipes]
MSCWEYTSTDLTWLLMRPALLCGDARMDDDYLLQCTGLDEYPTDDRISRYLNARRQMGYVKSLVYADKLQTLHHLEDNIRRVIADIRPQNVGKVIENWTSRLDYIRASRGSPTPEIIFKM